MEDYCHTGTAPGRISQMDSHLVRADQPAYPTMKEATMQYLREYRQWLLIPLVILLLLIGAFVGFATAAYLGPIIYRLI